MTKNQHIMILSGAGVIALLAGTALAAGHHDSWTALPRLPFILVATGLTFILGAGGLMRRDGRAAHTTGNEALDIEREDERNRAIAALSRARGFDFASEAFPATMLALGILRGSVDTIIVLFVVYVATLLVALTARARISREI